MNKTHDPAATSFVTSANDPAADFPIQNLPYGVFVRPQAPAERRVGVAIGSMILDLRAAHELGLFSALSLGIRAALGLENLNGIMSLGAPAWSALRAAIFEMLSAGSELSKNADQQSKVLIPMADVEMKLPALIRNYTDFYASIHHATNIGRLFRPDNPLLPNYKYVPIGYHGRASSIVLSGTEIHRPAGQIQRGEGEAPRFAPSAALDYELEIGLFIGPGNSLGSPISIEHAAEHMFGFCLLNDWSARDIQRWEYQPLGPFLAKNFATSISPWIVTMEALEPFRCSAFVRPAGDPPPLPYLHASHDQAQGALDIKLEVGIKCPSTQVPELISRSSSKELYWTPAQWVAHHTSNGCNLLPGDLLGSGTISGLEPNTAGCLAEITKGGKEPLMLKSGESRRFLQDGDEVIMTGFAVRPGARRIGFGQVRGRISEGPKPSDSR